MSLFLIMRDSLDASLAILQLYLFYKTVKGFQGKATKHYHD